MNEEAHTTAWLDGWTGTRRLYPERAIEPRRRSGVPFTVTPHSTPPARPIPMADSQYILRHGKKAYRAKLAAEQAARNAK